MVLIYEDENNSDDPKKFIKVKLQSDESFGDWVAFKESEFKESLKPGANSAFWQTIGLEAKACLFRIVVEVSKDFDWRDADCLKITLTFDEGWQIKDYPIIALRPNVEADDLKQQLRSAGMMLELKPCEDSGNWYYVIDKVVLQKSITAEDWFIAEFGFRRVDVSGLTADTMASDYTPSEQARIRVDILPCQFISLKTRTVPSVLKAANGTQNESRKGAAARRITLETGLEFSRTPCTVKPRLPLTRQVDDCKQYTFAFQYRENLERIENVETVYQGRPRTLSKNNSGVGSDTENETSPASSRRASRNVQTPARFPDLRASQTAKPTQPSTSTAVYDASPQQTTMRSSAPQPVLDTLARHALPTPFASDDVFGSSSGTAESDARSFSSELNHRPAKPSSLRNSLASRDDSDTLQDNEEGGTADLPSEAGHSLTAQHTSQPAATPNARNGSQGTPSVASNAMNSTNVTLTPSQRIIERLKEADNVGLHAARRQAEARKPFQAELETVQNTRRRIADQIANKNKEIDKLNGEIADLTMCDSEWEEQEVRIQDELAEQGEGGLEEDAIYRRLDAEVEALYHHREEQLLRADDSVKKTQKRRRSQVSANSTPTVNRGRKRLDAGLSVSDDGNADDDEAGGSGGDGEEEAADEGALNGQVSGGGGSDVQDARNQGRPARDS
ncbi:hypothetical protein PMZ80_002034 [Knufia obscura]|uniref:Uncharacterized protein n=2 Tax=Knufia TaxID=430999 RepID=A0AAN8EQL2_9EURO|nr:hypothetical protein PMZ80_002034 [Knufia obscura]KAK5953850.1 hypothetical protein OHC33_005120 [Knufia fluminis]